MIWHMGAGGVGDVGSADGDGDGNGVFEVCW